MKFLMQPPDKEISHFVLYIIIEVVLLKGLARGCVLLKVLLIKTKRLFFFSRFLECPITKVQSSTVNCNEEQIFLSIPLASNFSVIWE